MEKATLEIDPNQTPRTTSPHCTPAQQGDATKGRCDASTRLSTRSWGKSAERCFNRLLSRHSLTKIDRADEWATSAIDPNLSSGRAVQEVFVDLANAVLHQCIRSLIGALAPDHHGYQRAGDVISRQASTSRSGHQCSHAPGRPIFHCRLLLSQTLAGKLSYVIDSSSFCAVPLFVPGGRSFVPACVCRRAARRARQGWPSRGPCSSLPCCQAMP